MNINNNKFYFKSCRHCEKNLLEYHSIAGIRSFWNEVPYTRVEQGTYSTESETLPRQRNVTMLSRSFLRCRYAWVALSRSYLR